MALYWQDPRRKGHRWRSIGKSSRFIRQVALVIKGCLFHGSDDFILCALLSNFNKVLLRVCVCLEFYCHPTVIWLTGSDQIEDRNHLVKIFFLVFSLSSLLNHSTALPYCQSLGVKHPTVWKKTNKSERNQRIKRQTTNLVYSNYICWNGVREYFTKSMLHLL